jgi:hypothetical protein
MAFTGEGVGGEVDNEMEGGGNCKGTVIVGEEEGEGLCDGRVEGSPEVKVCGVEGNVDGVVTMEEKPADVVLDWDRL